MHYHILIMQKCNILITCIFEGNLAGNSYTL